MELSLSNLNKKQLFYKNLIQQNYQILNRINSKIIQMELLQLFDL